MQFLAENCLNKCQIFGQFSFSKTKYEATFGFLHIHNYYMHWVKLIWPQQWAARRHSLASHSIHVEEESFQGIEQRGSTQKPQKN